MQTARRNPGGNPIVWNLMVLRHWFLLTLAFAASVCIKPGVKAQCPVFTGTETVEALPATLATPHWFQCVGSVTADPGTFNFNLSAIPATHTGVVIDWGDGSPLENIGNWDGASAIPHTYSADEWQTFTITVTTNACPSGQQGIVVYEPENPGAVLVYGDNNAGCAPFDAFPKVDINLAFSPTWSFSLDWGDGSAPDNFTMEEVLTQPEYDTLKFTSSGGDEIYRILGANHVYSADGCALGECDHTLTLTYSNFCSVRGANNPFVPGGSIVGTGYKEASLGNAFLTWDIDEAEIEVAEPVLCWPNAETTVNNGACANCCDASEGNNIGGNGTVRMEKWDFGAGTFTGTGPDPTDWIEWSDDCSSTYDHPVSFPGPGVYTVTLYTQNHCGVDTATREIMVTPPPTVTASADLTTLCPGEQFQFDAVNWDADFPLTADDLSFNFTYGNGAFSMAIEMVDGLIPFENIPNQPGYVYDNAGVYNAAVQVFPTLAAGCAGIGTIPVTVLPPPTAGFTLPSDTCADNLTVTPVDASLDAVDYTWTLDGTGVIGSTSAPPEVTLNGPGAFAFTLEVTSANGCSDTFNEDIVLASVPEAAFTSESACIGSPILLDASSSSTDATQGGPITQYTWTVNGTPLSGETASYVLETAGTYPVTLEVTTSTGCSDGTTGSATVLPTPGIALATSDTIGCSPFVLPLVATDTTGGVANNALNWNFGHGSNNQLDGDGTHTWPSNNGEDTLQYTVTVEAGIGTCSDTKSLTVSVAPAPFVQTSSGEVCSGQSFSFEGSAFNLGEDGTWFWEVDNVWSTAATDYGTITSDFEGFSFTFVNPDQVTDTVSIEVDVQRPNGCAASNTATLLVRPEFAPAIEDVAGCVPFGLTTPNQVAISVDWDFGDPDNPDPEGATAHLYTAPGTYGVTATGVSVFGCAGDNSATVEVYDTPNPSISAQDALCAPEPVQPQRSDSGTDGATSWTLQVDLGTTYPWNGSPDTLIQLNPGTHLLTLLATNDEGCSAETSTTVLVQEEVTAAFSLPEGGCEPIAFGIETFDMSPGALATWIIDTPFGTDTVNSTTPTAPTWTANPAAPGMTGSTATYSVELQVVNPLTGCTAMAQDSIAVQPQPVGQLVIEGLSGCDVLATFSYTGIADSLIWNFGDPFAPDAEMTTFNSISHAYPNPLGTGYQTLASVTAISSGCADFDEVSLNVPALPTADFNVPDTLCMGEPLVLENLSTGIPLDLGTASGAWTWQIGGETLIGFEPTPPAADTTLLGTTALSNALLPLTLNVVHPENGCSDAISAQVVVLGVPQASFILTPDVDFEAPYETNVIDLNQGPTGTTTDWNIEAGGTLDAAGGIMSWADDAYGTHLVEVTLDNFGCSDSYSTAITLVPPPPTVSFAGDTVSCAPLQAVFEATIGSAVDSLVWSFGQGSGRTVTSLFEAPITFAYYEPGTYQVWVSAYGPGGTATSEPQTVEVLEQVNAGFTLFPSECVEVGDVVEFTPNFAYPDASYSWQFGDGSSLEVSDGSIVTHTYSEAGDPSITLVIENALCADSTSRSACIIEFQGGSVGVPSAFTPTFGGDGSGAQAYGDDDLRDNDVFFPQLRGTPVAYSFTIYNRWGEQIFSASDPNIGWNGHFQGKLCKQDVYVWRVAAVFLDGTSVEQAGDVTLIRR